MKKRPSLLLEIVLACSILTICVGSLIRGPSQLYQTEMKALKEMEKDRLADLSFAEMKMQLLNQKIRWNKLPSSKAAPTVISLSDVELRIPGCLKETLSRRAILTCKREKMSTQGELVRLIEIEIQFAPFAQKKGAYLYQAVARKMSPIGGESGQKS